MPSTSINPPPHHTPTTTTTTDHPSPSTNPQLETLLRLCDPRRRPHAAPDARLPDPPALPAQCLLAVSRAEGEGKGEGGGGVDRAEGEGGGRGREGREAGRGVDRAASKEGGESIEQQAKGEGREGGESIRVDRAASKVDRAEAKREGGEGRRVLVLAGPRVYLLLLIITPDRGRKEAAADRFVHRSDRRPRDPSPSIHTPSPKHTHTHTHTNNRDAYSCCSSPSIHTPFPPKKQQGCLPLLLLRPALPLPPPLARPRE